MKLDKPLNLNFDPESEDDRNSLNIENQESETSGEVWDSGEKNELESKLKDLQSKIETKEKEIKELSGVNTKLKKELEETKKQGGDADIDEFLQDLEPFYYNRNLTYVDVGAFVGDVFYKIHKSPKLRVREAHLFEPNPESFKLLKEKVDAIDNMPSLHAYNMAIGDQESEKTFLSAKSMTKIVDVEAENLDEKTAFKCKVSSLDAQASKVTDQKINLLKVDVEGYELEVLKGAKKLLKKQDIDIIYMEVGFNREGTQQTYFCELDSFLQDRHYRLFRIYEQKNEWVDDSPLLRRCNVAYMSERFSTRNSFKAVQEIRKLKIELEGLKSNK